MNGPVIPRRELRVPATRRGGRPLHAAARALAGLLLAPVYAAMAARLGPPGLSFRRRCQRLAWRQLLKVGYRLQLREIYKLLVYPMDSVRYFEFDFAWQCLGDLPIRDYLDVSSPRLLPLFLIEDRPAIDATLLNPNRGDLDVTVQYAHAMGVDRCCRCLADVIDKAGLPAESIDVVTCISVLEHIPEDHQAVEKMWSLIKPGGRLILTVPCAAEAAEEYTDQDQYGVLTPDEDGFVFWQRYYDAEMLQERVFSVTGKPTRQSVYGEVRAGLYARNVAEKITATERYPYWREPHMMATDFRHFDSLDALPGMGVIGLEFVKR
jgi:SAM-dependent methyltransferase